MGKLEDKLEDIEENVLDRLEEVEERVDAQEEDITNLYEDIRMLQDRVKTLEDRPQQIAQQNGRPPKNPKVFHVVEWPLVNGVPWIPQQGVDNVPAAF